MGRGGGAPTAKVKAVSHEGLGPVDPKQTNARLLVRRADVPEVEIAIEKNEFMIGRLAAESDLVLDDDLVSRKHAVLTMNDQGYFRLTDLGSKNGITFEGRMVRRLNLLDGDVFMIGKTEMTFRADLQRYLEPPAPQEADEASQDSVMVDVQVPIPRSEPKPDPNEPVGWDPNRPRPGSAERADPGEAPPEPDGEA